MYGKQLGFLDYELTTAKKQTKREKFFFEMEAVVPWQSLIDLIEPHVQPTGPSPRLRASRYSHSPVSPRQKREHSLSMPSRRSRSRQRASKVTVPS